MRDEFHSFLQMERVKRSINIPTIYDLIASHGNVEDLVFFAQLVEGASMSLSFPPATPSAPTP